MRKSSVHISQAQENKSEALVEGILFVDPSRSCLQLSQLHLVIQLAFWCFMGISLLCVRLGLGSDTTTINRG